MATYQREVRVDAPLDEVWAFHSAIDGLEALTPDWMNLRVEAIRGPDGDPDPEVLAPGTRIRLAARPFDVGPPQRWVSEITRRERGDGAAVFEDVMHGGPFETWRHTHQFFAADRGTLIRDRVEYEFPGGPIGRAAGPLGWVGFEPMFRYRHRRTKELLERR
jgi:ligand-binding SRPBCC domain-containing protein